MNTTKKFLLILVTPLVVVMLCAPALHSQTIRAGTAAEPALYSQLRSLTLHIQELRKELHDARAEIAELKNTVQQTTQPASRYQLLRAGGKLVRFDSQTGELALLNDQTGFWLRIVLKEGELTDLREARQVLSELGVEQ